MRALILLLLLAGPTSAQPPPDLAVGLAAIGRVIAPPEMAALHVPLQRGAPGRASP